MTINHLNKSIPNIKDIVVINHRFEYKNQKCVLAFLGKKEDKTVAWIVAEDIYSNYNSKFFKERENKTNRYIINRNFNDITYPLMHLKKVKFSNCELNVESSGTITSFIRSFKNKKNYCLYDICESIKYIFVILNKCSLGEFGSKSLDELCIFEYTFSNNVELSNLNNNLPMVLTFSNEIKRGKVNKNLNLKMGEYGGKKYSFRDKVTKEKQFMYIDRLIHYDIWEEAKTQFDNPRYKQVATDEQIEEMKKEYFKSLPSICPQGMDLAVLEYETEDESNLNIYTKEFLNEKVKISDKAFSILLHSDSKSLKGHTVRNCILGTIEKDFDGVMELEIFNYIKVLPDIELKI